MKINGKITILVNREQTTIELMDEDANTTFVRVVLTPDQLSSALSRLAYTDCEMDLFGLDRVGKKMEHKQFEFELPRKNMSSRDSEELSVIAQTILDNNNEGWITDTYFGSQDTFFTKNDKPYARCTIRRWV